MQELLIEGVTKATPMPLFGAAHLLPVLLLLLFVVFLGYLKKSSISKTSQARLGLSLIHI